VFAIASRINDGYYEQRQSEIQAFFGLLRAIGESTSVETLMRRFADSMTGFFGASAGHVYLLDRSGVMLEHKASTAAAWSPDTPASVTASPAMKRLNEARDVNKDSSAIRILLDSSWKARWNHFWSVPMMNRGKMAGVLQLAFPNRCEILPRDLQLLSVAAEHTLAAAERSQMIQDIAAREQHIFDLARRMLQVEEIERRRISRQLHDDAGQSLVVIRLQMEMIEQSMPPDAAEWRDRLAEARDITETTILHMRRLIAELSPAVLEQLGLAAGLRQLVNRFRQSYSCKVKLHIGKLPKLAGDFEIVVYRLAQECLKNISKHSGAANVNISVSVSDRVLRLRVVDDGVGFDVQEGLSKKRCFGLLGMRERVALLGGICRINTTPRGGDLKVRAKNTGTEVDIQLPILANSPSTSLQDVVG
jgi:signal transduction histidine kinase